MLIAAHLGKKLWNIHDKNSFIKRKEKRILMWKQQKVMIKLTEIVTKHAKQPSWEAVPEKKLFINGFRIV